MAKSIALKLDIDEEIINNTLKDFKPVDGRLKVIRLNECDIYIGKTDNSLITMDDELIDVSKISQIDFN